MSAAGTGRNHEPLGLSLTSTLARPAPGTTRQAEKGEPRGRPRLRALDGLRLLAALMVAAYHYGGRGGEVTTAWGSSPKEQFPTLHAYFSYGCLGVQVFFVISGFVICMSGWGRPSRAPSPTRSTWSTSTWAGWSSTPCTAAWASVRR